MSSTASDPHYQQLAKLISDLHTATATPPPTVEAAYALLKALRANFYENINQLQHAYMVFRARHYLEETLGIPENAEWKEHPMQTGDATEPDLCVRVADSVIASAEITTSDKPVGVIDSRMRNTLIKLSGMQGRLFYFVTTHAMEQRAKTKVLKFAHRIDVIRLSV